MPGPGYFSSPERPVPTYGARYPAASSCAVQAQAAGVSAAATLEPPKPGFVSITQPGRSPIAAANASAGMPASTSLVASTAATAVPAAGLATGGVSSMFKGGVKGVSAGA